MANLRDASRVLRIGTRGSRLALWQANAVASRLAAAGVRTEIVVVTTTGDRSADAPVVVGHKRQFVKELEDALLADAVDIAVHSAKDLPADLPDGLTLSACLSREDPLDAIVLPNSHGIQDWPRVAGQLERATIGTGSVRRIAQLAPRLSGATFAPVRGNVDTRLDKLDRADFGALVLACAGLRRLGFGSRIAAAIPIDDCVPAPCQGIVATEIRSRDQEAQQALGAIHDERAGQALAAERALVAALGGGCQIPLGALALHESGGLHMHAVVASLDGSRMVRGSLQGRVSAPTDLGRRLADDLTARGARAILDELG
jgi:hydroxymethylbilane synthase